MPRIFISYRRADSITMTGRIHDRLVARYGEKNVFKDVDDIPLGVDFRTVLEDEVNAQRFKGHAGNSSRNVSGAPRALPYDFGSSGEPGGRLSVANHPF